MAPKYPLEALHALRARRVQERALGLSEQESARRAAEQLAEDARTRRENAQQAAEAVVESERARLGEGGVRVAELAQAAEWHAREQARIAELVAAQERARAGVALERERSEAARLALARADADAQSVEAHREAWESRRRERLEQAEEEAIVEQWTAKRHPPRGG